MSYAEISNQVQALVIDLPTATVSEIPGQIQQAQKELEDAHGFIAMEKVYQFATIPDTRGPYALPDRYLRARTDARPVLVDGIGATVQLDWLMEYSDQTVLYSDDPIEVGRPRVLVENIDNFEVFPLPDQLSPSGTIASDGNWIIRVPYFQREEPLGLSGATVTDNWFSDNAAQYLAYAAAARLMAFNRDWEEASLNAALALDLKNQAIKNDKKRRLSRKRLMRPQRGARGSAYQFRGLR
jgi:hypothetical protein